MPKNETKADRHLKNLERFARLAAAANVAIGVLVLLGWAFGWEKVKAISSAFPALTPNTAVSLLLLGCALFCRQRSGPFTDARPGRSLMVPLVAGLLLLIGVAALAERFLPGELWINHALINLFLPAETPLDHDQMKYPAASTALCLCLLAASLLLERRWPSAAQAVLLPAFFVIIFSLVGQVFHLAAPGGLRAYLFLTMMAPHTALALLLAVAGFLARAPGSSFVTRLLGEGPASEVARIFTLFALFVPIFLMGGSLAAEELPFYQSVYVQSLLFLATLGGIAVASFVSVRTLESSEGRFFELTEQAADAIFLADLKGNILHVNSAACELLGYSAAAELVGRNALEILGPGSAARLDAVRFRLLHSHSISRGEWQIVHRGGQLVPVEISSRILKDGTWLAIARDTSARKKQEENLRFLANAGEVLIGSLDYQDMAQKTADALVPFLADFCTVFTKEEDELRVSAVAHVDPARRDFLLSLAESYPSRDSARIGVSRAPGETLSLFETVREEDLRLLAQDERHLQLMRESGTTSYLSAPLIARDKVIGAVSLGITSRDRHFAWSDADFYRQIIHRFSLSLDNARLYRDAQLAIRAREEVLAIVSHDLKNPMAAADVALQLATMRLEEVDSTTPVRDLIGKARFSIQRMKRLVDMLLNFGRLQAGTFEARRAPMDFERLFDDVREIFQGLAAARNVTLDFHAESDAPFEGDCDALSQALSNLLSNALKFSPPGSTIRVRGALSEAGEVRLQVSDEGPGVPREIQSRLFDRYWQPKGANRDGAGLGLYIVRGVARAHGGEASVASEPGRGSTFTLRFPGRADARAEALALPNAS